jgi:hypothetical protein
MAEDKIVKIYDLSTKGATDVKKDLKDINKLFVDIAKNKLSLNGLKASIEDPEELKKIDKELTDLLLTEKQLAKQLKEKQLALKEYQLIQAKEREENRKQKAGLQSLEGSYNDIAKKYRDLLAISKNATILTDPKEVQQAQTELKKYKDLLDNFNRGLTKDGTLVGEYTTGILQAFKNSGLDSVINDQINNAKKNVKDLDDEFEKLKNELEEVRKTGQGSLSVLEQQLLENRRAAGDFQNQINRVENELRNMSTTGSTITGAIGLQFKNLKNEIGGFVLGFVGFQAALGGIQSFTSGAVDEFLQADNAVARFESRLTNLGRIKELEGINLQIDDLVAKFKNLDNDDLTGAAEQLVTYGKVTEAQIKQLLPIIVDFSANAKIGIGEATSVIIKGLEGNGKALKEYGIDLKDAGNASEAYGLITKDLASKVRGSAETFSGTAAGALAQNKQALADQQEILGEKLLPLYIKFTSATVAFASVLAAIPFGPAITLLGLLAAGWIYYKTVTIAAWIATQAATQGTLLNRAALLLESAAIAISNGYKTAATTLTWLYVAAQVRLAAATGATNIITRIFAATMAFLASPIGIIIGLTTVLVTVFGVLSAKANQTQGAIDAYNKRLRESAAANRVNAEANERANKQTSETIALLKTKLLIAKNEALSLATRKKAVEDIVAVDKEYFKGLNLTNIATAQGALLIDKYIDQLNRKAKAEAYAQLITEKQKKLLELQGKRDQIIIENGTDFGNGEYEVRDNRSFFGFVKDLATGNKGAVEQFQEVEKGIADVNDEVKYLNGLLAKNKDIQVELNKIQSAAGTGLVTQTTTGGPKDKRDPKKPEKINRIENLKKDYEAEMNVLKTALTDKEITEDQYNSRVLAKIVKFREQKIKAISKLDADELQSKKAFDNELRQQRAETLDKMFQKDVTELQQQKEIRDKEIQNTLDENEKRVDITELNRARFRGQLDAQLLQSEQTFNAGMINVEAAYKVASANSAQERADAILAIEKRLADDKRNIKLKEFEQLKIDQQNELNRVASNATQGSFDIYSGSGTATEKAKAIKELEKKAIKEANDIRLNQMTAEIAANDLLLQQKIISQVEYNERIKELENERLGILKQANDAELENEQKKNDLKEKLIAGAWQVAEKFINSYIEGQKAEADANYNSIKEKLNNERDRRLGFAQSKAEEQAIKDEFEAKEKEAEIQRNKERQRIARQQLAIEFAVAAIKALSTSPTIVDGLIKSGIVLGEYLAALSLLNKQKFARGGRVQPETIGNGIVTNTPNINPLPNGDNVLGYLKPGEVVLNQSQQAALGGPSTFAAIGVPGFNNSVNPPIFRNAYGLIQQPGADGNNDELKSMIYQLADIVYKESTKPVILDPNAVRKENNNYYNNVNIATL